MQPSYAIKLPHCNKAVGDTIETPVTINQFSLTFDCRLVLHSKIAADKYVCSKITTYQ